MQQIFIFLLALTSLASAGKCGFAHFAELSQQKKKPVVAKYALESGCITEDYYDSIFVDTSAHFRVFYTLEGPHAVTSLDYVDTLLFWLEKARKLHVDSLGMLAPQGPAISYHYRDARFPQKYPVELIDLGMIRDGSCEGCYGLTLPDSDDPKLSTLFIENDFLYAPSMGIDLTYNSCPYVRSTLPITSQVQGSTINYAQEWGKALRVTAAHELYHACQLRYQDYAEHYHFWFEASAVGVEELAAPDLNDYTQYLQSTVNSPRNSLLDSSSSAPYGQSLLFHYMQTQFGRKFDHLIWSRLSEDPKRGIAYIFDDELLSRGLKGGFPSFYAEYVRNLVPSGARLLSSDPAKIWHSDQIIWPSLKLLSYKSTDDLPSKPFSYGLYAESVALNAWIPTPSSQLTKQGIQLEDSNFVLVTAGFAPDRQNFTSSLESVAYPIPWKGHGNLIFRTNFGEYVEVRDGAGVKVLHIPIDATTRKAVWKESELKRMAPGIYYWRGQSESTLHRIILIR